MKKNKIFLMGGIYRNTGPANVNLSGGAGSIEDFVTLFKKIPDVSAGLAASIFHFGEVDIRELKRELDKNGILVRL